MYISENLQKTSKQCFQTTKEMRPPSSPLEEFLDYFIKHYTTTCQDAVFGSLLHKAFAEFVDLVDPLDIISSNKELNRCISDCRKFYILLRQRGYFLTVGTGSNTRVYGLRIKASVSPPVVPQSLITRLESSKNNNVQQFAKKRKINSM
jgi:hypothetical protein